MESDLGDLETEQSLSLQIETAANMAIATKHLTD